MPSSISTSGSSAQSELRRLAAAVLLCSACRGEMPKAGFDIAGLVDSLRPGVEQSVGLPFKTTPRSQMVSKDAVRSYILGRLDREFPQSKRDGMQAAYRLFGLLPDTLDLEKLLLDLYGEQVAGYYDPETSTLYGVEGGDRTQLRLILAHELVHALQHQYLPLDSLMSTKGDGDRTAATQAVLEGHATLASIALLAPGVDVIHTQEFWDTYKEQVRTSQSSMPIFAKAPLILRESLIFPYVSGAEFMRWWALTKHPPLPARGELPMSTEQVLHPDRYPADQPVTVRFEDSTAKVLFEDTFGELETQILLASFRGAAVTGLDRAIGWGGDRYRVYETPGGPGLVWLTAWDAEPQRDRFQAAAEEGFKKLARPGYQVTVESIALGSRPGVRVEHVPKT
ncbi:MAG TPA: hypothetical protein VJU15_04820 [Gemmatimonadales bacterium]|nr:hypothetical protein [Gemmatimonadales bacterium]